MGAMRSFTRKDDNSTLYRQVMSALDGVSKIRLGTSNRPECPIETRCNKLRGIEDALVTLDRFQRRGAIETVRGVQRIRGLAGSGKTVVLARKAAYLHVLHPEWVIGVTFHTRSLKAHFRRLIRRFVYEDGRVEPNWDKLHIINAWGASGAAHRTGIYHQFCTQHDLEYLDFRRASSSFGRDRAFDSICKKAIQESDSLTPYYDAILIDEAQDLPPSFLRLCHHFLKPPKRLVYCYDELQNLTGESLPPPEDIFGRRNGSPVVRLPASQGPAPKPDIVLPTCYRTPGPVLVVAHAIGFGIYRRPSSDSSTGLVQMFDHPILWEDIGYKVVHGTLEPGSDVELVRGPTTSPSFLEAHSSRDDLVQFKCFDSTEEQQVWLVKAIEENLRTDKLMASDIMVIHPDPQKTRRAVGPIQSMLYDRGIDAHIAGVDTSADTFMREDRESVTFTSVHRAKGNEAGMVYVINAHEGLSTRRNLASIRNRLFTAITRSKAWVRVVGVGQEMGELCREFGRLTENNFKLRFNYPTEEESSRLRNIHRDMSRAEESRLNSRNRSIGDLVADLESGQLEVPDLDQAIVSKLVTLFRNVR